MRKGQSILEYVIILTAVVGIIMVASTLLFNHDNSKGLGKIMSNAGGAAVNLTGEIGNNLVNTTEQ